MLSEFKEIKKKYDKKEKVSIGILSEKSNRFTLVKEIDNCSQMNLFSDSIIITYECKKLSGDMINLYLILNDISVLAIQLLTYGIFIRGGFTYGDLYHEQDVCFGPALVEAVKLEKEALYPRVAVSNCIIDIKSSDFPYRNHTIVPESYKFITEEMISKDLTEKRKMAFIDYLYLYMTEESAVHIKDIICTQLDKNYDEYIMEKYIWFAFYYNETINAIPLRNAEYINDKRIIDKYYK